MKPSPMTANKIKMIQNLEVVKKKFHASVSFYIVGRKKCCAFKEKSVVQYIRACIYDE
jgi:hypothetical protein